MPDDLRGVNPDTESRRRAWEDLYRRRAAQRGARAIDKAAVAGAFDPDLGEAPKINLPDEAFSFELPPGEPAREILRSGRRRREDQEVDLAMQGVAASETRARQALRARALRQAAAKATAGVQAGADRERLLQAAAGVGVGVRYGAGKARRAEDQAVSEILGKAGESEAAERARVSTEMPTSGEITSPLMRSADRASRAVDRSARQFERGAAQRAQEQDYLMGPRLAGAGKAATRAVSESSRGPFTGEQFAQIFGTPPDAGPMADIVPEERYRRAVRRASFGDLSQEDRVELDAARAAYDASRPDKPWQAKPDPVGAVGSDDLRTFRPDDSEAMTSLQLEQAGYIPVDMRPRKPKPDIPSKKPTEAMAPITSKMPVNIPVGMRGTASRPRPSGDQVWDRRMKEEAAARDERRVQAEEGRLGRMGQPDERQAAADEAEAIPDEILLDPAKRADLEKQFEGTVRRAALYGAMRRRAPKAGREASPTEVWREEMFKGKKSKLDEVTAKANEDGTVTPDEQAAIDEAERATARYAGAPTGPEPKEPKDPNAPETQDRRERAERNIWARAQYEKKAAEAEAKGDMAEAERYRLLASQVGLSGMAGERADVEAERRSERKRIGQALQELWAQKLSFSDEADLRDKAGYRARVKAQAAQRSGDSVTSGQIERWTSEIFEELKTGTLQDRQEQLETMLRAIESGGAAPTAPPTPAPAPEPKKSWYDQGSQAPEDPRADDLHMAQAFATQFGVDLTEGLSMAMQNGTDQAAVETIERLRRDTPWYRRAGIDAALLLGEWRS